MFMNTMKQHVRFFRSAILTAGLWSALCWSCDSSSGSSVETPTEALPVSSMMVARVNDLRATKHRIASCLCSEAFDSLALVRSMEDGLRLLARLEGRSEPTQPVWIAASKVGAKGISLLYVGSVRKDPPETFGADTLTSVDRYEKTDITTLKTPGGAFCYYVRDGALILSDNRLYLEQSILQQTSQEVSLSRDRSFVKSYPVLFGGKTAAVFRLPALAHYGEKVLGLHPGITGELAAWAAVELHADSTTLRAEGLFCTDDSTASLVSVLQGQKVKDIALDAYFPSDTYRYTYLGICEWPRYFSDYIRYLKASSQYHLYNTAARTYPEPLSNDPGSFFAPWAGTGLAVVQTAADPQGSILIGVNDSEAAARALETLIDSSAALPDPYRGTTIVPIGRKNLFYELVTHAAPRDAAAYAAVAGPVAVFSPSLAALRKILDDIRLGTTLGNIQPYRDQKAGLATNTQMLTLVRGDLWSAETARLAREKRRKGTARNPVESYVLSYEKQIKDLRYNFFQVSATGGTAFLNLRMAWDDAAAREAVKEWSFALGAPAAIAPVAFPNHRNGRYDVLIQDTEGTLYLISDSGSLFWKKKLGGTISSPILVCDLYDNRKYQMAFWTGDRFHVIDRLGNYVTAADKVARAKKAQPDKAQARIVSTNEIGYPQGGDTRKVKTPHSPLAGAVYIPSLQALAYRLADGRVYAVRTDGTPLPGFPVTAEKDFTAQDFGRDGRLGVAALSPEGVIAFYRLPRGEKKN